MAIGPISGQAATHNIAGATPIRPFRMRGAAADPDCAVDPRERARRSRRDRWLMDLREQRLRRRNGVLPSGILVVAGLLPVPVVLMDDARLLPVWYVWVGICALPLFCFMVRTARAHRRILHLEERLADDRTVRGEATYRARHGLRLWSRLPQGLQRVLLVTQFLAVLLVVVLLARAGWDLRGGGPFGVAILCGCLVVPSLLVLAGLWPTRRRRA